MNLVVGERHGAAAVLKIAGSERATVVLVQFFHAAERGVFEFQSYNPDGLGWLQGTCPASVWRSPSHRSLRLHIIRYWLHF